MVYSEGFTLFLSPKMVLGRVKVELAGDAAEKTKIKYIRLILGRLIAVPSQYCYLMLRDTRPKGRTMRTHTFITGAMLLAGSFIAGPALTQNAPVQPAIQNVSVMPIGKVVTAAGSVTIEHVTAVVVQAALGNQPGQAKVGDPIYLGDVLSTGADGRVGIAFADGTAFDLSSNARMAMTEFIYDPNSTSNSTLLSLTKGTFTFVAGKIAKSGDMKVDTPVATMGIRGTTPRVEISDDGTVKFSSLIEEGKDKGAARPAVSPGPGNIEERAKPNLEICRGC
jgi:hypothetical protein